MKANKLFPVLTFLAGIVAGGLLLGMMSFSSPGPAAPPQPVLINYQTAHTYYTNYIAIPPPVYNNVIRGLFIDVKQYEAMRAIFDSDNSVSGFRIYYGKVDRDNMAAIVVGTRTDAGGIPRDVTTGSIYRTEMVRVGPCPDVCDNESTIVTGHE